MNRRQPGLSPATSDLTSRRARLRSALENGGAPIRKASRGGLRVDTVYQGDQDGNKGGYHINAVDEVTQWEVLGATPQISEAWLIPVLETMLMQFFWVPFRFPQRVHQSPR